MLQIEDDLLAMYAFYVAVLVVKVLAMGPLTGRQRMKTKTVINLEDAKDGFKVGLDPDVERVRRAHLNDLENVVPFLILGFAYLMINPSKAVASWHFRVFTVARIIHSIGYLNESQLIRGGGYAFGLLASVSIALQIVLKTCCHW